MTTSTILNSMIPVSRFNKGEAGRIFDDLSRDKTKIVIKNNMPIAVILSPETYARLIDEAADNILLAEATVRMTRSSQNDFISQADFMSAISITEEDINSIDEVEID